MSTYIDPVHPNRYKVDSDVPDDVLDYLHYLGTVKMRSARTINGYYIDLRSFCRYLYRSKIDDSVEVPAQVEMRELTTAVLDSVTKGDLFEYLEYLRTELGNESAAIHRKLSALKGFFHYLFSETQRIHQDPALDISIGKTRKSLPKYLTLDESLELLKNIQSDFYERDFCIVTLFLNCGMRLSELCTINMSDFKDDTIRIVGKGNKERLVYLNHACQDALQHYLKERAGLKNLTDRQALFVSKRTGKRLTPRRVEQIVGRCLKTAGLDGRGYSPHKLRHTAATLMYQHGNVDMLALKEILGHENVSTTQIYTHINTRQLRDAVASSPLSSIKFVEETAPSQPDESEKDS